MRIIFSDNAWDDYQYWVSNDGNTLARLNALIEQCRRDPFKGTGKPEPLKGDLQGWWSRRITTADRLVYRVEGKVNNPSLGIAQCRLRY